MAEPLKGPAFFLDGRPVELLEIRDNGGHCSACLRAGMVALLVGSAKQGEPRTWVVARRRSQRSFITHHCQDLEDAAA